jgi:hypothetical protein
MRSVEKNISKKGTQISPLRCAPVEMTKGSAALPATIVAEQGSFSVGGQVAFRLYRLRQSSGAPSFVQGIELKNFRPQQFHPRVLTAAANSVSSPCVSFQSMQPSVMLWP